MSIKVTCDSCGREVAEGSINVFRYWDNVPLALAARPENVAFDDDFHVCNKCIIRVLESICGGFRAEFCGDTFAGRLKSAMHGRRMSQKELAQMAGVTESAISCYMAGRRFPRANTAKKLADALGLTVDELIGVDE